MKVINPIDEVSFLVKTSKKQQAIFLSELEDVLFNSTEYDKVRKLFLDVINDYTRQQVKRLVGEIEDLVR